MLGTTGLTLVYAANVIVAGIVGYIAFFGSQDLVTRAFGAEFFGTSTRVVGALWLAIALTSLAGLFYPSVFAPVLLIQLIYKGSWLLMYGMPLFLTSGTGGLTGMFWFFLAWIVVLPFVIPWQRLFS